MLAEVCDGQANPVIVEVVSERRGEVRIHDPHGNRGVRYLQAVNGGISAVDEQDLPRIAEIRRNEVRLIDIIVYALTICLVRRGDEVRVHIRIQEPFHNETRAIHEITADVTSDPNNVDPGLVYRLRDVVGEDAIRVPPEVIDPRLGIV